MSTSEQNKYIVRRFPITGGAGSPATIPVTLVKAEELLPYLTRQPVTGRGQDGMAYCLTARNIFRVQRVSA